MHPFIERGHVMSDTTEKIYRGKAISAYGNICRAGDHKNILTDLLAVGSSVGACIFLIKVCHHIDSMIHEKSQDVTLSKSSVELLSSCQSTMNCKRSHLLDCLVLRINLMSPSELIFTARACTSFIAMVSGRSFPSLANQS